MRYRIVRSTGTIKKAIACLALLTGSYLVSALTNASPITQPALTGAYSRGRVVIVAPSPAAPDASPAPRPAAALAPAPRVLEL